MLLLLPLITGILKSLKLIELGADLNTKNKNGTTLLMYALNYYQRSNDLTLFRLFLELGADTIIYR